MPQVSAEKEDEERELPEWMLKSDTKEKTDECDDQDTDISHKGSHPSEAKKRRESPTAHAGLLKPDGSSDHGNQETEVTCDAHETSSQVVSVNNSHFSVHHGITLKHELCLSWFSQTDSFQRKRRACKYGESCYRRNPVHKEEFSHPGNEDYALEPDQEETQSADDGACDQRPECQYGTSCYRKNPQHRRDFKHTKPPEDAGADDRAEAKKTRRPRPGILSRPIINVLEIDPFIIQFDTAKRRRPADEDEYESEGENEYDLNDSFISDSDEEEEWGEEDEEYKPDENEIDPELLKEEAWKAKADDAPEVLELLKEARDYLRNKKLQKWFSRF